MSELVYVNQKGVIWLFTQTQETVWLATDGRGMSVEVEGCSDNFLEWMQNAWELEYVGEL